MSQPLLDKYATGIYTTQQNQEIPQFNVASGISLDAWRQSNLPQAPLQPPPQPPPPFNYNTYGEPIEPISNRQLPPQYSVGNQADLDLYTSTYPQLENRLQLNPHADWIGGMGGLYLSTGFPFPNPPAGYNIQEATKLELASMGGFQGLEALGGNVATNDTWLASMTSQYGQAFGGSQQAIPLVKIDPRQIANWGWLIGMVLGGVPYQQLLIANKKTNILSPQDKGTDKDNLPIWSSAVITLNPHKLYSIVMDSATDTNAYLGFLGKPPTQARAEYNLPPNYITNNFLTTGLAKKKFLEGLSNKDITEIKEAEKELNKKSGLVGGGLTQAEQFLLTNLEQLLNNDNIQKEQIPKNQRGLLKSANSTYTQDTKGRLAAAIASKEWINNFLHSIIRTLSSQSKQLNIEELFISYYISYLQNQQLLIDPQNLLPQLEQEGLQIAVLKPNFGSQFQSSILGFINNKSVYEKVINAPPQQQKEYNLNTKGEENYIGWIKKYSQQEYQELIKLLQKLNTQQSQANINNSHIAIQEIKNRNINIAKIDIQKIKFDINLGSRQYPQLLDIFRVVLEGVKSSGYLQGVLLNFYVDYIVYTALSRLIATQREGQTFEKLDTELGIKPTPPVQQALVQEKRQRAKEKEGLTFEKLDKELGIKPSIQVREAVKKEE